MRRTLSVITAVVLFGSSLVGWAVFLTGQGLENADRWVTVVGFFASTLLSVATAALAWRTLRGPVTTPQLSVAGSGGVVVGQDNFGSISTSVSGRTLPPAAGGAGAGSVLVGGSSSAPITTRVDLDRTPQP
ncbi:hypothetical protein [Micromonospora thermarum]|uniref:Uncharacterized protein n=1 Tax=Micromonospora thermarum TaxID=2720024 RepID=A0ABX0Z3S4_9ACTN|nr:hypothetical protein [Micromonospora thermarum]NJP31833.1 hypothetical protein [Micromonospora thermarum]